MSKIPEKNIAFEDKERLERAQKLTEKTFDDTGLMLRGAPDGGDSLMTHHFYHNGLYWLKKFNLGDPSKWPFSSTADYVIGVISTTADCWGLYWRHPGVDTEWPWTGTCSGGTRDQTQGMVISFGNFKQWKRLFLYWLRHLLYRGMLFLYNTRPNHAYPKGHPRYDKRTVEWSIKRHIQHIFGKRFSPQPYWWKIPDFSDPEYWALYLRACRPIGFVFYFALQVFDIVTFIGAFSLVSRTKKNRRDCDDNNSLQVLFNGLTNLPTFWIHAAREVYLTRHMPLSPAEKEPGTASNDVPPTTDPSQMAMDSYWRGFHWDPPLNELYRPLIKFFLHDKTAYRVHLLPDMVLYTAWGGFQWYMIWRYLL